MVKYVLTLLIFILTLIANSELHGQNSIEFKSQTINVGRLYIDTVEKAWLFNAVYKFYNRSDKPIQIVDVVAQFDFCSPEYSMKSILPNDSSIIKVGCHCTSIGNFTKQLTVHFYNNPEPYILTLKGELAIAPTFSDSCPKLNIDVIIRGESITLNPKTILRLDSVYNKMKHYPLCKIHVKGHCNPSEEGQQISWDKVATIIKYLCRKGIKKEKFIFDYGDYENGNPSIVNLTSSTDAGPTWVPQPHPCYSLYQPRKKRCTHGIPH